jgi:hypothetical protein
MATGQDGLKGSAKAPFGGEEDPSPTVADLLQRLNLTEEEVAVVEFSDEEDAEELPPIEFAVVGKVLSPMAVHVNTIRTAMKPAWGNPFGLKFRAIGEKGDNMFMAEFGTKADLERVLSGTPWMVGKHAIVLKLYDEKLSASEIVFDRMDIWVRILNLPLGWMNQQRGARVMSLIGSVVKLDVDSDGKASGAFLRGRVSIEIDKPLRRGVLLRMSKSEEPKWFEAQYEKLPYYCSSCGMLGHSEIGCSQPAQRNEAGKLPYDIQLRAPEEKKRRFQTFGGAAAESYGSRSSSAARTPKDHYSRSSDGRASRGYEESHRSASDLLEADEVQEVQSPLKTDGGGSQPKGRIGGLIGKKLVLETSDRPTPRKRKSKGTGETVQTSDLDVVVEASNAIVPVGLVNSRVSQLDGGAETSGDSMTEKLKKQKRSSNTQSAISAAAAIDSPRRAP